ncbi:nucleic acid-binding protein [Auriscalpium vulgare]|uniref:Nucleic acid-binding protein n=1 Tax=Auriscalpium vulgare TaxID=40419 RepID=A0ACB8SCU9_9AGAM|nr:nucleic acid-binding protein [Auriscalpium vulgare]
MSQSLRPVNVRQLNNATQAHADAEWMVENSEIGQLTIIGQVVNIKRQATNNVYWLDDGGGRIEARHWSDSTSDGEGGGFDGIVEDAWVRVTGMLKMFGSKRYINAVHIRPVKDHQEIFFHLAEVMSTQLIFDRGPPAPADKGNGGASAYTAQAQAATSNQYSHLPAVPRNIITFMLAQPPSEEGIHIGAIARAVGADADEISNGVERLMDDGLIFSTIDETHFNVSV